MRDRLAEYRELGARFTKWRAVYAIGDATPGESCIRTNADALARFAALSQEAGLVPILEPEVLMDGSHTIERSEAVSRRVWQSVFEAAYSQGIELASMLLKTNMVLPGYDCPEQATPQQIAERTIESLACHVPPAVPGVVFLSGGQSEETATINLDAINRTDGHAWELSFSFGRALQSSALHAWADAPDDAAAAQARLLARTEATAAARAGAYRATEPAAAGSRN